MTQEATPDATTTGQALVLTKERAADMFTAARKADRAGQAQLSIQLMNKANSGVYDPIVEEIVKPTYDFATAYAPEPLPPPPPLKGPGATKKAWVKWAMEAFRPTGGYDQEVLEQMTVPGIRQLCYANGLIDEETGN